MRSCSSRVRTRTRRTRAPAVEHRRQVRDARVGQAEVRQRFADLGMTVDAATPDALDGYIKTEIAKWSKVIKDADIRAPE